jgi:hypothetical protein
MPQVAQERKGQYCFFGRIYANVTRNKLLNCQGQRWVQEQK